MSTIEKIFINVCIFVFTFFVVLMLCSNDSISLDISNIDEITCQYDNDGEPHYYVVYDHEENIMEVTVEVYKQLKDNHEGSFIFKRHTCFSNYSKLIRIPNSETIHFK